MEGWFACNAANNDKGACLAKKGACTWSDWANYTSLPLPTRRMTRRMMQDGGDAAEAPEEGAAAASESEPGACQLSEVYELRAGESWDLLGAMSFLISHVDTDGESATLSRVGMPGWE
jgi:hypothetical protein